MSRITRRSGYLFSSKIFLFCSIFLVIFFTHSSALATVDAVVSAVQVDMTSRTYKVLLADVDSTAQTKPVIKTLDSISTRDGHIGYLRMESKVIDVYLVYAKENYKTAKSDIKYVWIPGNDIKAKKEEIIPFNIDPSKENVHDLALQVLSINGQFVPVVVLAKTRTASQGGSVIDLAVRAGVNQWIVLTILDTKNVGIFDRGLQLVVENNVTARIGINFNFYPLWTVPSKLYEFSVTFTPNGYIPSVVQIVSSSPYAKDFKQGDESYVYHEDNTKNLNPDSIYRIYRDSKTKQWTTPQKIITKVNSRAWSPYAYTDDSELGRSMLALSDQIRFTTLMDLKAYIFQKDSNKFTTIPIQSLKTAGDSYFEITTPRQPNIFNIHNYYIATARVSGLTISQYDVNLDFHSLDLGKNSSSKPKVITQNVINLRPGTKGVFHDVNVGWLLRR